MHLFRYNTAVGIFSLIIPNLPVSPSLKPATASIIKLNDIEKTAQTADILPASSAFRCLLWRDGTAIQAISRANPAR